MYGGCLLCPLYTLLGVYGGCLLCPLYPLTLDMNEFTIQRFNLVKGPLVQSEGRCSSFDMEIVFHSHANKTHFHKKGCAPSLILKVRVFGTRKWHNVLLMTITN